MLDGIQKVFNTCFRFTELLFVEGEIDIFSVKQIQDCGNDGLDGSIIVQHIHGGLNYQIFDPLLPNRLLFTVGSFLFHRHAFVVTVGHTSVASAAFAAEVSPTVAAK